jgi:hypothetical protein
MSHSIRPYGTQPPAVVPPAGQLHPPTRSQAVVQVDADAPVFDLHDARVLLGFPRRAFRRHRKLGLAIFLAVMAATIVMAIITPRHYYVETKFFAEQNVVMPALNNPGRAMGTEGNAPTKLATDAVQQRDNLIQIIRETNLLGQWEQMRSPVGQARDRLAAYLHGPMSDSDRVNALVAMMSNQMWVGANEGTVTIGIDWANPIMAYSIIQAAQQNFFERRHVTEVAMIGESIGILEEHVERARQSIQEAVAQIKALHQASAPARTAAAATARATPATSPVVVGLQAELAAKEQTIADIEVARKQQISALQAHLTELRNKFGAAHPEVIATQENMRAMSNPSTQIVQLQADVRTLRQRITALGAVPDAPSAPTQLLFARETLERLARPVVDSVEDPTVTYAKSQLRNSIENYEDLLRRLQGARIELETARAAFKYRYRIITPPQVPRQATSPKVSKIVMQGVVLGVVLVVFAVVALDLMSGMVLERWQVDRQLGLPVLADVRLP